MMNTYSEPKIDLVRRLRNHALPDPYDEREVLHAPLLKEAADEIESLRERVKNLEGVLEIVYDSGLLMGNFELHDKIRAEVYKALALGFKIKT